MRAGRTARTEARAPGTRGRGFTLVELVISVVIFLVLMGTVFQMYTKGSKAGAKATWRSQVTGKSRAALRRIKEAVDGTSYPSVVSYTDYAETTPGYGFRLQAATASTAGGAVTTYTWDAEGEVLRFFACHPAVPPLMATPGVPNGQAAEYVFELEQSAHYGGNRLDLRMRVSTGPVTGDSSGITVGALTEVQSLKIATELERVELAIPTGGATGNAVVSFRLVSRDPIDGRMRVIEESRANVNTAILPPGS